MGTKFLSVLTSVAVLIGIFSGPVVSAKANTAEGLEYNIANGQAIITKYTGNAADLVIPDTIQEYPVTEIYDQAFHNCTSLKNITIPAGVKREFFPPLGDSVVYHLNFGSISVIDR